MKDKAFQKLINKAIVSAASNSNIQSQLTDAFIARYGKTYSDLDLDEIIDVLDYGGGTNLSVAEIDALMEKAGAPKL